MYSITFDGDRRRKVLDSIVVVKLGGNVATQLQMLQLIFAYGHVCALVEEYIRCLQYWIRVQAERCIGNAVRLEFELMHLAELWHCHLAAQDPRELTVVRHLEEFKF